MTLKLRCKVEQATIHEATGLLLQPGEIEIAETAEAYEAARLVCEDGLAEPVLSSEQLAEIAKRAAEEEEVAKAEAARLQREAADAEEAKRLAEQPAAPPTPEGPEAITASDLGALSEGGGQ